MVHLPRSLKALISTALAVYAKSGKSCFKPVRCLDGIGASGIMGLLWKKHILDNIGVTINDSRTKACERIKENAQLNDLNVKVLNRDTCALLHEQTYNFISLNCHTVAACYLDSAFRNLPKDGILAITTTDDAALHAITPEIALRNYAGFVTRTLYKKELAVRLFLAAVARAAARYNKGVHVLCSVAFKSSFTVLLTVKRGPTHANKSIRNIRKLIHCSMCEDRTFYPLTNYPIESPSSLLGCDCSSNLPGKVVLELGPVWSGSIFNEEFLVAMYHHSCKFPWKVKASVLLGQLVAEARCSITNENNLPQPQGNNFVVKREHETEEENSVKRLKVHNDVPSDREILNSGKLISVSTIKSENMNPVITLDSDKDSAPPFYFNLHRHSLKGPQLLRVDIVIQFLRRAGYRASRTHFDREAVRTNANLSDLTKILTQAANMNTQ
ncbi:TRMT1-like protein isoform X2 [Zootermopsis nevadensis]|uniref:TRMT1-like protein isoform X2 n=1 Tax=Zootermopsis nevadensis TaxID=136037 RepID=UPI000B8E6303|nr:TRMT1-like protein isoform X2 [Zootermopsis nevadensis]